ncbi:unnamed protein product [Meloidogyne enterolobii]|uniref:Uncharacterized protein n=1 Tax=Meloidogyne enterolobii TaxID=390850 RepID=A0ACB0YX56_MELEN
MLVSSSLPSIRMPQHQQPQLHKHSTPTGSTSTPSSTPPTFRPGTLPNLQPFKRMPEKQNSQLANTRIFFLAFLIPFLIFLFFSFNCQTTPTIV